MSTSEQSPLGGEPSTSGRFLFEVDGVEIGMFREVSGLQLDVTVGSDGGSLPARTISAPYVIPASWKVR